ncbi:hypothetical protein ACLMJK_000895 [Lecanora helva]
MATTIAKTMGKRVLGEKIAGKQSKEKKSKDIYKYYDAREHRLKRKNLAYFEALGIPKHDAKILVKVMHRAKVMDGWKWGSFRFGASTVIQLVPEAGDIINGLISFWIVKTAGKVSDGFDGSQRLVMYSNIFKEVGIGLFPVLGDILDGFFQANTRNAAVLEKMLIDRVKGEKLRIENDHSPARNHASERRNRNGHVRTETPPGYDDRHAGVHDRLQAKAHPKSEGKTRRSETNGGGGQGWLNKMSSQRAKGSGDSRPSRPPRPTVDVRVDDSTRDGSLPPARPPRRGHKGYHRGGSFEG